MIKIFLVWGQQQLKSAGRFTASVGFFVRPSFYSFESLKDQARLLDV